MTTDPLPLRDIQANILAGFRADHQAFLLVSFAQGDARGWLAEIVDSITSTPEPEKRETNGLNIGLTYSGLLSLDRAIEPTLERFGAFKAGPAGERNPSPLAAVDPKNPRRLTTAQLVGDIGESAPENWIFGADEPPVHAVLTVAEREEGSLRAAVKEQEDRAERLMLNLLHVGYARVLRDEDGRAVEHFGFRDGVSQPGIKNYTKGKRCDRHGLEDEKRPGSLVIEAGEFLLGYGREPECDHSRNDAAPPPWMRAGSFQVVKRLIQDVRAWREQLDGNSQRLKGVSPDQLAALAVGRHPNGQPLETDARSTGELNHFDFSNDDVGETTPRFAHIRKVNPRNNQLFCDNRHRILRRGITFGDPLDLDNGKAETEGEERGLWFNAFGRSIEDGYEFLQKNWLNNPRFPTAVFDPTSDPHNGDGADPVVGIIRQGSRCALRRNEHTEWLDFRRAVYTTGAVYAFAPSIPTLKEMAHGEPLQLED